MSPADKIKVAFAALVEKLGGIEAVGAILKISHQRVSQCQVLGNDQLPSLMQVMKLEQLAGQAMVTGEMARLCELPVVTASALQEASELTIAASKVVELVMAGADARAIQTAIQTVMKEASDVPRAVSAS